MSTTKQRLTRLEARMDGLEAGVTLDNPGVAIPTRYALAQHDAVFGWKKGDPVSGAPGDTYTSDGLGKYEFYADPDKYGGIGANATERNLWVAARDAGLVPDSPEGLETLLGYLALSYEDGMAELGETYRKFRLWFTLFSAR